MSVNTLSVNALSVNTLPAGALPAGTLTAGPPAADIPPGEVFPAGALPADALTWGPRGLPVPHAASWSGEEVDVRGLFFGAKGLAYRDERPADRDRHGVLWARVPEQRGAGKPNFGAMHPMRQRAAMLGMRCQVCGGPADRTSKGWLFVLPSREAVERDGGMLVSKPPLCVPCAHLALRWCPHLGDSVALRSRKPRVWGVTGELLHPKGRLPGAATLPYGEHTVRWVLATQVVLELTRCTLTSLPTPT
jgi:hypothetical protein